MARFRFHEKHGDLIGAHISTKGGLHTVFERASIINASAIALFAKNSNQWKGKVLTDDDVALFAKLRNVKPILTHASYLINLATTNAELHRKSPDVLERGDDELAQVGDGGMRPGSFDGLLQRLQAKQDRRQRLPRLVVQLSREAAALQLLGVDHTAQRVTGDALREVDRQRCPGGEGLRKAEVVVGETRVRPELVMRRDQADRVRSRDERNP